MTDLNAEVRSTLQQFPSVHNWTALVQLLDQAPDDQLTELVAYTSPQLERWPDIHVEQGVFGEAAGDLCVMPDHWLRAFMKGHRSPKYELVRAIVLRKEHKLSVDQITALLDKMHELPALKTLDLCYKAVTRSVLNTLIKHPKVSQITRLVLHLYNPVKPEWLTRLSTAASLAQLHTLVLHGPQVPKGFLCGTWSEGLEVLAIDREQPMEWLAGEGAALTSLKHYGLNLSWYWSDEDEIKARIEYLTNSSVLSRIQTLSINTSNEDLLPDFFAHLAAQHTPHLTHLDLSTLKSQTYQGDSGETFMRRCLTQPTLIERVTDITVHDSFDVQTCLAMEDVGFTVHSPGRQLTQKVQQATQPERVSLAAGEQERRQSKRFDITDAMLLNEPSPRSWRILCGVVDDLERHLDPEAFAQAIQELLSYAARFDDELRVTPRHWWGLFGDEALHPKLQLVRRLRLEWFALGRHHRTIAEQAHFIEQSAHAQMLTFLDLDKLDFNKKSSAALAELCVTVGPHTIRLLRCQPKLEKAIEAAMSGQDVTWVRDRAPALEPLHYKTCEGLKAKDVRINVETLGDLRALLLSDESLIDEVVALELRVQVKPTPQELTQLQQDVSLGSPAWTSLRMLDLHIQDKDLNAWMLPWFFEARPLIIEAGNIELLTHGVWSRATGSTLQVNAQIFDELKSCCKLGLVRPGKLILNHRGDESRPHDLRELYEVMHPEMRRSLVGLDWMLSQDDMTRFSELMPGFDSLTMWCPELPDMHQHHKALVAALSAEDSLTRLAYVGPYEQDRYADGRLPVFTAAFTKTLSAGCGLRPGAWVNYKRGFFPRVGDFY